MKKIYFLCLAAISISVSSIAQAGNLDSSFGIDGQIHTTINVGGNNLYGGALQDDGKIISGGSSGYPLHNTIARYKSNGRLDLSFGIHGVSDFKLSDGTSEIHAIAIQPDGKIVATGYSNEPGFNHSNDFSLTVLRFTKDGAIDSSFGKNGAVILSKHEFDIRGNAIAVQNDGKIVVAAAEDHFINTTTREYAAVIARFTNNGQPDSSFNGNGIKSISPGNFIGATSLALLPDGKILAGLFMWKDSLSTLEYTVIKFTASGKQDASFGNNGVAFAPFPNQVSTYVNAIALQPNGKIVLGGALRGYGYIEDFALVRFNANGVIDSAYGTNGLVHTDFGYKDILQSLVAQPDGKIVALGSSIDYAITNESHFALARYNINGSLDSGFGTHGRILSFIKPRRFCYGNKVLLQPDGKIVAMGNADNRNGDPIFGLERYLGNASATAQLNSKISLKIAPDPAKNLLQITGLIDNSPTILTITDLAGNLLKRIYVTSGSYICNIQDLKSGSYYLTAESKNTKASVLFIKE